MATVLVVDDSPLSRRISRRILEEGGHTITEAGDGFAALERYALDRPDVVLLDVTMTDMNGLEVLSKLRALDPDARIVMATADVQASTRALAADGGALGFIPKPFAPEAVLKAVGDAISAPGVVA